MDRAQAERMIMDIYAARKRGDSVGMTANFHDNATYRMNAGAPMLTPSLKTSANRQELIDTFAAIMNEYHFGDDWKVVRFMHDGDASLLIWHGTVTSNTTQKSHFFEVFAFVTYKDGKILSVIESTDTAAILALS